MAQNEDDLDLDIETKPKSSGGMKKIIIISVIAIALIGGTVATTVMLVGGSDQEEVEDEEDMYADEDDEEDDDEDRKKKKKKKVKKDKNKKQAKKNRSKSKKKVKKTPHYLELDKPIVVNLDGSSGVRFLQISVALMTYEEANLEKIKTHLPVIRHNLVLLFSSQNFANLQTVAGKKNLQKNALAMIRDELKKLIGEPLVEDLYFPSIVGQ